ncbi:MAG TPA: DNA repair protein RecO [Candidatus Acidoferrum sp.]|nr:DNA repair protein RecO [Candidatus Acidoferrum sp.]
MDVRTNGIILRTRLLTETSLIVHWLTRDVGRVATVAKGARRPKSAFRGKLDLFYHADFSFSRSSRSELHHLREVMLRDTHSALRDDYTRLQQASYAVALIELTTETETPVPEIFALMSSLLHELVTNAPGVRNVFAFELKLLEELGLSPHVEESKLTAGTRQIAVKLVRDNWATLRTLMLTPTQAEELRQFLHGFLLYHLGKLPRGRAEALHI